jgi:alcohol dehydrogenase class IV
MLGACHAFAHALGAMRGVPHGVANGLFLVPIMRFNVPKARAVYARLGAALGGQGDESGLVEHALLCVEQTVHDVAGVPRRLRDLEVSEAELATLAKAALTDPDVQTNPVQLTDLDRAVEIVQAIW